MIKHSLVNNKYIVGNGNFAEFTNIFYINFLISGKYLTLKDIMLPYISVQIEDGLQILNYYFVIDFN